MPFNEDELKELSVAELSDICTRLKISVRGKKSVMIERILNSERNPDAMNREEVDDGDQPPRSPPPPPQQETFDSVIADLGLHADTKKLLSVNNFATVADLRKLTPLDCSRMNMPLRDEKELMVFNGKAVKDPVVLHVNHEKSFRTKPLFNPVEPAPRIPG